MNTTRFLCLLLSLLALCLPAWADSIDDYLRERPNLTRAIQRADNGQYLGIWDNYRVENAFSGIGDKAIWTMGTLTSQKRVEATISDSTCELATPAPFYYGGKWYFAHSTAAYVNAAKETNNWGLMRLDGGTRWVRHAFIDAQVVSPAYAVGMKTTALWGPQPFIDDDGTLRIFFTIGTNTVAGQGSAQTALNMKAYETHPLDDSLLTWSTPVWCRGVTLGGFENNVVKPRGSSVYRMYHRVPTDSSYIDVFESQSIAGPWVLTKSGNWAGWGNDLEAPDIRQLADGTWFGLFATNGSFNGTIYGTSATGDTWTPLVHIDNSGNYGHGSLWPCPQNLVTPAETRLYPFSTDTTFGTAWAIGGYTSNTPPVNQTLIVNGGTVGWLSLDGTLATGISTDPSARGHGGFLPVPTLRV